jgi:uncharacterized membrane protein
MEYCPNCGRIAGGRFCQFCGYDSFRGPIQSQTQYSPQQYQGATVPVQYGPSVGESIGSSPMAKMGVIILFLCILGLILVVVVPWAIAEREIGGDYEYTYVCQDCGYSDEDYFFRCPRCDSYDIDSEEEYIEGDIASFSFNYDLELVDGDEDEWGGDQFTEDEAAEDYLKGTIGQAFVGIILSLIIAIILIILGIKASSSRGQTASFHGFGAVMAAILIIPSLMIILSGINFLGYDIQEMHQESNFEELGIEVSSSYIYPAAYLILLFGFIILIIALVLTRKEIRKISSSQQIQSKQPEYPQYPGGGAYG